MKSRIYLDYNSTIPLAKTVQECFAKGIFVCENPSSSHTSGKKSNQIINQVSKYLFKEFHLNDSDYHLVYHSGTTEFINTFFKSFVLSSFIDNKKSQICFSDLDHQCLVNQEDFFKQFKCDVTKLKSNKKGEFLFNNLKTDQTFGLLNFTWVNNITGIVNSLEITSQLKKKKNLLIHVDSTQAIGKIKDWKILNPDVDAYTFSGHKFGALKGVGFSFVKKDLFNFELINGGGQQKFRSGTLNTTGILSLRLALEELNKEQKDYSFLRNSFEEKLKSNLGDKIEVIGFSGTRNFNTSCILFNDLNVQDLFNVIDMNNFDISFGSACSSGVVSSNMAIHCMGYSEIESKRILRFSFPIKKNETIEAETKRLIDLIIKYVN